jgi:hypothetical protein
MDKQSVKLFAIDGKDPANCPLWTATVAAILREVEDHVNKRVITWMSTPRKQFWVQLVPTFHLLSSPADGSDYAAGNPVADVLGIVLEATNIDREMVRSQKLLDIMQVCKQLAKTKDAKYRELGFLLLVAGSSTIEPDVFKFSETLADATRESLFAPEDAKSHALLKVESVMDSTELKTLAADFILTAIRRNRYGPAGTS